MGKLIGLAGSAGMLAFVAMLLFDFFKYAGVISPAFIRRMRKACLLSVAPAVIYWLCGYLMYCVIYGSYVIDITDIQALFPSNTLKDNIHSLKAPVFSDPFTWLFSWMGHLIGRILFENYLLGGMVLVFLLIIGGVYFLLARGEMMIGKTDTERLLTLCFSLPGAFVLFLPGCAPILFFSIALIIYFSFARFATMQICLSDYAYRVLLVFISVASAAVLFAAVAGKFA